MLLRIANSPSPIVVQSTVAEREILNRSSTIARPDRGAAFWARIAGLGSESDEYRPLRESYSRNYDHDPLFLAMDLAFGAVCIYKGLQAKYPSSSLAAVVRGKSHEEHLLETVRAIECQSWAFYRVHRAWNTEETLDLAGRTVLLRLLVRARVVSAVVNTLGRSYRPAQAASQHFINRLMIQLVRPSPSTPNVESEMTIRPRINAQTVDGNDEMAPSSPTVATTDPGPGFRNALDRRIRSLRDPSRTARHLPNVPSSLVDPGSPRQQLAVGNIPSSSPVQVVRENPQSSESPTPTRARQVHARSLSEEESTIGADDNRAHSPSSSPPLEELPPHQGASPIAPSGSDWPTDNGMMKWIPFSQRTAPFDQSSNLPVKRLGEHCRLSMRIGSRCTVSKGTTTCSLTLTTQSGTRSSPEPHHQSSDFTPEKPGDIGRCLWMIMLSRRRTGGRFDRASRA
jgi:hypothetical protein